MKKENDIKTVFRFLFLLTVLVIAASVALIVFAFRTVDELGLWQCLFIAIMMALVVVLTVLTIRKGMQAYGR